MSAYTVNEAAALLKLHPKTVRRKIRDGELGSTRIGRQFRITQDQLDAFCADLAPVASTQPVVKKRQVVTSCVVDVDAISPEEGSRITNSLMAVLNGEQSGARVDSLYYEETGQLKIILHGSVQSCQRLLGLVEQLLQPRA